MPVILLPFAFCPRVERTWICVWYFNPFAWQLIFVLGFLCAADQGLGKTVRRWRRALRPAAWIVVAVGAWLAVNDVAPDPTRVPEPTLFFIVDKSYLTPLRLLHFLALALAFAGSFGLILRAAPPSSAAPPRVSEQA